MAEISGLAIGTIALASLFSTCIDLFERFESGKSQPVDYELACTKISLLKARFTNWGESLDITISEADSNAFKFTPEYETVKRSLLGITEVFENAADLASKYGLSPKVSGWTGLSQTRTPPSPLIKSHTALQFRTDSSTKLTWITKFRRRTSWAVYDKHKFDDIIQDLDFLIRNLESVAISIMSSQTPNLGRVRQAPIVHQNSKIENIKSEENEGHSLATQQSRNDNSSSVLAFVNEANPVQLNEMNGNYYAMQIKLENETNFHAGNVGDDKRHMYTGSLDSKNSQNTHLGNVSSEIYKDRLKVKKDGGQNEDNTEVSRHIPK